MAGSLVGLSKSAKGMPNLSASGGAGSTDWLDDVREQLPVAKAAGYFPTGVFGPCARQLIDRTNELLELPHQGPANPRYLHVMKWVTPRTRLVAMSHVSRQRGQVVPASELAPALRGRGVSLLLDGAQGPGNVPINFSELGCDYYSLCGHKWLLGPKGTGALLNSQRAYRFDGSFMDGCPCSGRDGRRG